jgi:CheY-like chemotaxis protein
MHGWTMVGEQSEQPEARQDKPVLLIVEDHFLTRCTAAVYLREAGYRVIEAGDAAEAISVLSSGARVDFVFSDVYMPGPLDGHGLARWVAQHQPALPVLLTSAAPQDAAVLASGPARHFLTKPYKLTEVQQLIAALL